MPFASSSSRAIVSVSHGGTCLSESRKSCLEQPGPPPDCSRNTIVDCSREVFGHPDQRPVRRVAGKLEQLADDPTDDRRPLALQEYQLLTSVNREKFGKLAALSRSLCGR